MLSSPQLGMRASCSSLMQSSASWLEVTELTRADLLQFLKDKGLIREVKGMVEVTVQTMDGGSFDVTLEEGGAVAGLKSEIQEAQGAKPYRQQLFMLGAEGGSEVQEPLPDDQEIRGSCMMMLCVQAEEEWSWDTSSPLLKREVFELRGPNNSAAVKICQHGSIENCMMAGPVMEAATGKHTISMQLETGGGIFCGVVSDGAACDEDHTNPGSTVGWFISDFTGVLRGNGYLDDIDDADGRIQSGAVLTMQVDTDIGTLKFWVNGKPHGRGFTGGVRQPLRWATTIYRESNTTAIVPTPAALQQ